MMQAILRGSDLARPIFLGLVRSGSAAVYRSRRPWIGKVLGVQQARQVALPARRTSGAVLQPALRLQAQARACHPFVPLHVPR